MSCRSSSSDRGFTLLEVMVATVIIAMLMFSLYRFVNSTLIALKYSTEVHDERQSMQALIKFLQQELNDLPAVRPGAITGAPFKFHDLSSDELSWLCSAGLGVLTDAAPDNYRVTLALQPVEKGSDVLELGLRREYAGTENDQRLDADFFSRGSGSNKYNWLPLMRGIAAIRVRYYDSRLNAPVDRWTDINARPALVMLSIWRNPDDPPYEAVLDVPSARLANVAGTQPAAPTDGTAAPAATPVNGGATINTPAPTNLPNRKR